MSLVIGGVAVGGALVTGAVGAVGSYAAGQVISHVAGGGSGGGGGGGSPAASADPFANERYPYMQNLRDFMGANPQINPDPYNANNYARQDPAAALGISVPGQTRGGELMQQMLTPGYQFNSDDPSYKWRLDQGAGALAASGAARGLLNSGSIATALTDYGQNAASQEYAAQFGRASAQDTSAQRLGQNTFSNQMAQLMNQQGMRQQTFGNLLSLNSQQHTEEGNLYTRLAQLAGANIGNPGVAGQLTQQQNAATAAGLQQIIDPVTGAIKNGIKGAWGGNSSASGGSVDTLWGNGGAFTGTGSIAD